MAKKKKSKRSKFTARTADKHELYQYSVQDPEFEVAFISRVYRKLRGKKPMTLREDFCGTALFCAGWVESAKGRTATGVDIDPSVLSWGKEKNLAPIGEPGNRITLLQQDVLKKVRGKFDITVAFNFSYWIFDTRPTMLAYFKNVRSSLEKDGLFYLDAYGGYEANEDMEESRKIDEGFTYIWDQNKIDPINNRVLNHIHFEFKDGTKMRKAFTYDWRAWTLLEIRELLEEAGFKNVTVYWEDSDADGEGTGVYRPRKEVDNEPAWVAYIVAEA